MEKGLQAVLRLTRLSVPLGAPIEVVIEVKNPETTALGFDLRYPDPFDLTLRTEGGPVASTAPDRARPGRSLPVRLGPGEGWKCRIYLNRYMPFPRPGDYTVAYSGSLVQWVSDDPSRVWTKLLEGTLTFKVVHRDERQISTILSEATAGMESDDRFDRLQSLEAAANLDESLALPVLERALAMDDLAFHAVLALRRLESASATTILQRALGVREAGVVQIALEALRARDARVSDEEYDKLLRSENDAIRYAAADDLSRRGDRAGLLKRIARDPNVGVAGLANLPRRSPPKEK